ncbi:unnamed protein product, partial [Adineta ricciae]
MKSHYPACRRKQTNVIPTVTKRPLPSNKKTSTTNDAQAAGISDLQCLACHKDNISFVAKDKKSLTSHMRAKHPETYENSKKVANIRVAWSKDEDILLANLELELKSIQKGQILDRLCSEWNKKVEKSHANFRSKDAIRTRRQQAAYKATLHDIQTRMQTTIQNKKKDDVSDDDQTSSESEDDAEVHNATTSNNDNNRSDEDDVSTIKNLLRELLSRNGNKLSAYMSEAIQTFLNPNQATDAVQLTMLGINHAITNIRNRSTKNSSSRQGDKNMLATNKKLARNPSRIRKANERAYYQHLYKHNKSRLMDELINGVPPNSEPPPIHDAVQFYEQMWSTCTHDQHGVEVKIQSNNNDYQLLSPITKIDIANAIKRTKRETAKGVDMITLQEAKQLAEDELLIAFNIWLG